MSSRSGRAKGVSANRGRCRDDYHMIESGSHEGKDSEETRVDREVSTIRTLKDVVHERMYLWGTRLSLVGGTLCIRGALAVSK